jgi:hypothetical protein
MRDEFFKHKFLFNEYSVPVSREFLRDKDAGGILFDRILGKEIIEIFDKDCYKFLQEKSDDCLFSLYEECLTLSYALVIGWRLPPKQYTYAAICWPDLLNGSTMIHI